MSPPDSAEKRPGISVPKAKNDIYTVMLGIALLAIIIACVLLWMEMARYEYKFKVSQRANSAPVAVAASDFASLPVAVGSPTNRAA